CWGLFGGRMEKDETPEKAIVREIKEELDFKLKSFHLFRRYGSDKENDWERFVFISDLEHPVEKLREVQKEGSDLGLFSYEEIKKMNVAKDHVPIIEHFFTMHTLKQKLLKGNDDEF
ncbi:MAG: NUDIX domain-containing protein, partial [archaeon]